MSCPIYFLKKKNVFKIFDRGKREIVNIRIGASRVFFIGDQGDKINVIRERGDSFLVIRYSHDMTPTSVFRLANDGGYRLDGDTCHAMREDINIIIKPRFPGKDIGRRCIALL